MRTIPIADQFEPAPAEKSLADKSTLPSGQAMLQSGVLGTQLLRLAELAARDHSGTRVKASLAGEPTR